MLEIQDDPIIVRFLSQVCIRSTDKVSVIECTGLDEKGRRWRFYQNNHYYLAPDGSIQTSLGNLYGFYRLPNRPA